MEVMQYQIVLVNLDPTVGSEIKKTRPCVIISPDEMNDNLRTIVIAPMTTKTHNYPTRVKVNQNDQLSWVILDQVRTIDKSRIIKTLGGLSAKEQAACKMVIKETYVD
ncbi:type II toxin-antitoxin system PemK/MazF family toxin [Litoribacter ruber]|uniref:type II toxin-antitoxin system PemK/MazF family toxin n=1 Tax=Litoribacter ruber TaxID=702568 RepID=UPI001BD972DD|nr:type II toxin-antitoxin system PemK/MazF family toxin [Litoribacter ruber]MBT0810135.1 type II toxin-antitoxin system PemK/MazF family toxin [Litoribacter ruber]